MNDKIEEIRARHTSDTWRRYELKAQIHDDRAWLLAEADYQRAENERLRAEIDGLQEGLALMKSGFEIAYRAMGGKP